MKILSLFDGMACGMLALLKAGIEIKSYDAYEIDKYAIQTATHNFPQISEHGDVFQADFTHYKGIDLLIGGSPCTYWSIAQKNNRETTASGIGWELFSQYVRAVKATKPKFFIYENNKSMSSAIRASITQTFGFEPICINSALVSAQNRQRLYWVGQRAANGTYCKVDVQQPQDKGILLKDVLDGVTDREKGRAIIGSAGRTTTREYFNKSQGNMAYEPVIYQVPHGFNDGGIKYGKSPTLTANGSWQNNNFISEPVGVAQRGRYTESGKRSYKCSGGTEQFFEARTDGKSNCVSTVKKDCLAAEPVYQYATLSDKYYHGDKDTQVLGKIESKNTSDNKGQPAQGTRVYNTNCKSICLDTDSRKYIIDQAPMADTMCAQEGKAKKCPPIYKVENGLISIKGKQYPIKLADGYYIIRKLTVSECKRLQTVPEWYEFPVSDTQAYKMLGNGWTVDVIAHILGYLKEEKKMMNEREKLIELLLQSELKAEKLGIFNCHRSEAKAGIVADFLLESGVIVPPVKVGDTVYTNVSWQGWYLRDKDKPYKAKVVYIGINGSKNYVNVVYEKNDNMLTFTFDEIGDRIFLTREEAEKALAERSDKE